MANKKKKKLSPNVASIVWPTDTWGYTADFKKAFIVMMSKLNGADDKKELIDEVLEIMQEFKDVRYEDSKRIREQLIKSVKVEEVETATDDTEAVLFDD